MALHRIIGPPGTGKTQTISKNVERAVQRYGEKGVVVCALTRAAASEAADRVMLPKSQIGTVHSLIYHELDGPKIAELHLSQWNSDNPTIALADDKASVDEPMPERTSGSTSAVQAFARANTLRMQRVAREIWPENVVNFMEQWEAWKADCGFIDFTDMLEYALEHIDRVPNDPRVLFVDEVQDQATLEIDLINKWARHTLETVIVGDPWQCLFAFRGSDPSAAFPLGCEARVLKQSYRVPQAVHEAAMQWISHMPGHYPIEYYPTRNVGTVQRVPFNNADGDRLVKFLDTIPQDESVMVITSCAYMLQPFLAECRAKGLTFSNRRRVKSGAWNPLRTSKGGALHERLLAFLRPWRTVSGDDAAFWSAQELASWVAPLESVLTFKTGAKTKIDALGKDPLASSGDVAHLIGEYMIDSARDTLPQPSATEDTTHAAALWWTSRLLRKHKEKGKYLAKIIDVDPRGLVKRPRLTVGTIHSLKGAEADHVVLFPELSVAGLDEYRNPRVSASVYRQFYVGMTRAKKSLYLGAVNSSGVRW